MALELFPFARSIVVLIFNRIFGAASFYEFCYYLFFNFLGLYYRQLMCLLLWSYLEF